MHYPSVSQGPLPGGGRTTLPSCRAPPYPDGWMCPYCYENRKGRANHPGHRYRIGGAPRKPSTLYHLSTEFVMKREITTTQGSPDGYQPPSEPLLKDFPLVAQFLSDGFWEDGKPRDVPSLSIIVGVDSVTLSFVDLPERRSTSTTAKTIKDGLRLLEALCARPSLPWRYWGPAKKR